MALAIKDRIDEGVDAAAEQGVMGADLLTGATAAAVEAAGNPVRTVRRLERRGAPINSQLKRSATRRVNEAEDALQSYLPEQILLSGLRLIKERARRKDLLGEFAFRTLTMINDGFQVAGTLVKRMERASAPPSRAAARSPLTTSVREVKTASRRAARATGGTVSKTRGTARRASTAARRTERRPAVRRAG